MRVRLRPDTHYAPVPQGLYVAQGGRDFVLAGPPALHELVDGLLGPLTAGADLDELTAATGDPAARPVLAHVLGQLLQQGALLDLDALTVPAPDPRTAAEYADVLAHLESRSADPYRDFAALRAATVTVLGAGTDPATRTAVRTLRGAGVDDLPGGEAERTALTLRSAGWTVTVHTDDRYALIGDGTEPAALTGRIAAWLDARPHEAAPTPLSATLAGSLAAHTALDRLLGGPGRPGPLLIHGQQLTTRQLPALPARTAPEWSALAGLPGADGAPAADAASSPLGAAADAGAVPPDAAAVLGTLTPLTAPWTGLVVPGDDGPLPQLPVSLATVRPIGGDLLAGWGRTRAAAVLDAVLQALRVLAGRDRPSGPCPAGAVPAAGSTPTRFLLDGALRLPQAALTAPSPVAWEDLDSARQRSMWSVLDEWFHRDTTLTVRRLDGTGWCLAEVADTTGELRAAAWGADRSAALEAALTAAAAQAQADPGIRARLAAAGPATSVEHLTGDQAGAALTSLARHLADRGGTLRAVVRTHDPVLGPLPATAGRVWCA
ncbi:hypothetical protein [Actinacidiphila yeochonensis]|uniref:hypothetical protein n=1 Tax=Actinacidiphila yeochonensis TaxID=89050 RepID=UPI0005678162|nr:hypothetical protein [Actinacidiphila yeochonensis]